MSAELYSNGKGQYSLEQLPDFYALDEDEIESNVEIHTFSSHRDADFFLEGVEATGRLDMDMTATLSPPRTRNLERTHQLVRGGNAFKYAPRDSAF